MSGQIFISYRREDSSAWARLLYDRLDSRFASKIFIDVDSLAPGVDFVEALEQSVGVCDVLIAVIGRRWLSASDEQGRRRLDKPEDFVRIEIATALKRGIRVIPVLVEGALVPPAADLPEDLKALARRHALAVRHERFRADSEQLVGAVEQVLESVRVEQQRQREEQPRREAERRQHEERERLQTEPRAPAERRELEPQPEEQARLRAEQRLRTEQERLEAQRREREEKERLELDRREKEGRERLRAEQDRLEAERREREEKERRQAEQPESERCQQEEKEETSRLQVLANLKKRGRLLVAIGSGVAILLLSFGLLNRPSANALLSLQKAAEAGDTESMYSLGVLYDQGKGVDQDRAQAREWYQKAADAGNAAAKSALRSLSKNLRDEQIRVQNDRALEPTPNLRDEQIRAQNDRALGRTPKLTDEQIRAQNDRALGRTPKLTDEQIRAQNDRALGRTPK